MHGAGAPQVKKKARERLAELVDPSITALAELIRSKKTPSVRLAASKDILDRTGHGAPKRLEFGGDISMSRDSYTELNVKTLTEEEAERLEQLTAKFEGGHYLTRSEQAELHSIRKKAGGRKWLRISTPQATFHLPDNGR